MDKYTRAHNKMALATGETKTRTKLTKSKHGWLKIAMGITFASSSLFAVGNTSHAEIHNDNNINGITATQNTADAISTTNQQADQNVTPEKGTIKINFTQNGKTINTKLIKLADIDLDQINNDDDLAKLKAEIVKQLPDNFAIANDFNFNYQKQINSYDIPVVDTENSNKNNDSVTDSSKQQTDNPKQTVDQNTDKHNQDTNPEQKQNADNKQAAQTDDNQQSVANDQATTNQDENKSGQQVVDNNVDSKQKNQDNQNNQQKQNDHDEQGKQNKQADQNNQNDQDVQNQEKENNQNNNEQKQQTVPTQNSNQRNVQLAAQQSSSYTLSGWQNVRNGAGLNYGVTGQLDAGDTIYYDRTQQADGYTWLHYKNFNGEDRWVAQMSNNNNVINSNQAFIDSLKAGAIDTWHKYGVLPSVSIAQAIVESAWGKAAPGNNLFGIKGSYNGQSVSVKTSEYINGQWITVYAQFRAYPSFAESIMDHGSFLANNSRYSNLLGDTNYAEVCRLLQQDGYATDPSYANTLISIINSNNLTQYDQNNGTPGQGGNSGNNTPNDNGNATNNISGSYTVSGWENVRSGAGLGYGVTGQLDNGDTIRYDSTQQADGYTWLHYKNYNGQDRWVAQMDNSNPAPTPAPQPAPSQPAENNNSGSYKLTGWQNVRSGAGLGYGVTGNLDAGDTIYYDSTQQADGYTWLHYKNYKGQDRWVAQMDNSNPAPTPAPQPAPSQPAENNNSGSYKLTGWQNVRSGAGLGYGVTGNLDAGDTIYYDGTQQADGYTWLHYKNYKGQDRWVAQMSNNNPAPQPTPQPTTNNNSGRYTLTGSENVRSGSYIGNNITGQLDAGDTIVYDRTVQSGGYTWLHYINFAGQDRWVAEL